MEVRLEVRLLTGVGLGVGTGLGVGAGVGDPAGVGVAVGAGVIVAEPLGAGVGVAVALPLGAGVGVCVGPAEGDEPDALQATCAKQRSAAGTIIKRRTITAELQSKPIRSGQTKPCGFIVISATRPELRSLSFDRDALSVREFLEPG